MQIEDKDGRECLAEAFVRYRNGEWIPDEAKKTYQKIYPSLAEGLE